MIQKPNYSIAKNTGRCRCMDTAMSEMKVQNEVPVPNLTSKNLDK